MLHTILIILKILGIVLGILVGLLLLLLLAILFLPICYRAEGAFYKDRKEKFLRTVVRWCFGLVAVRLDYDDKIKWKVRVAFWKWGSDKLPDKEEDEPPDDKAEKKKDKKEEKKKEKERKKADHGKEDEEEKGEEDPLSFQEVEPEDPLDKTGPGMEEQLEEMDLAEKENAGKGFIEKLKKIWEKIKEIWGKIKDKIRDIEDKLKWLLEQKEKTQDFLEDATHQKAFHIVKDEGVWFLKKLKPKDIRGRFAFGFEDPSTTGYVLAGLSVLYPVYEDRLEVLPDFETQIMEVEGRVRGRIYLWWGVKVLLGLLCKKAVRTTWKDAMKYKNNMKRGKERSK